MCRYEHKRFHRSKIYYEEGGVWNIERTLLHRSQTQNLRSCTAGRSMGISAANFTTTAWEQNIHELEVLKAAVEMQVQSWTTNNEFGLKFK